MMNRLFVAPVGIIAALFRAPQFDEHVKAWRWYLHTQHAAFSLHVTDYYLWKEFYRATP